MRLLAVLCALLPAGAAPSSGAQPQRPPNFVFILADDLGWADLAIYGSDLHETPNLDRLAAQGLRFTDAYAAAPVCSPTRASLMTGKYPARLRMTIWREGALRPPGNTPLAPPQAASDLPHSEVTLAEVLQQAGYLTAHIGKWHLGDAGHYPETQGFDINVGGTQWGAPQTFFYPYRGNRYFGGEFRYIPGLPWGQHGEYLTDRLTDEALRVIERAGRRPFFLNLWYHTVHTPIEGKPELVQRYRTKVHPGLQHRNPVYAAMVRSLDENVGRVLAKLEEADLANDTIIVFTSDNGGFVNNWQGEQVTDNHPLRSGKGSLYEGGIRVPLIIRWPGLVKPGSICTEPVGSIDLYPTLLEIAGLPGDPRHNADVDGVSLLALLKDPSARLARDTLFFHYPHYYATTTPVSALRAGDWKLLQYYEDGRVELYHLAEDLGEAEDLSARLPDKARMLRERLNAWLSSASAQLPVPNPGYRP